MTSVTIRLIVVCLALLAIASPAAAQMALMPPPHIQTLDLPLMRATRVVVGRVAGFERDASGRWQVTVAVGETLKGSSGAELTVDVGAIQGRDSTADAVLNEWRQSSTPLLIAAPWNAAVGPLIVDLADPELAVMTADLTLLRTADAVVAAARGIVRRTPDVSVPMTFGIPVEVERVSGTTLDTRTRSSAPAAFLLADVPVDERLELYARAQLGAPMHERRVNAIEALELFRSPSNIGLLRQLLGDDRDWRDRFFGPDQSGEIRRIQYNDVRRTAHAVLRRMGVDVEEPVSMRPADPNAQVISVALDQRPATSRDVRILENYPNLEDLYLSGQTLTADDWAVVGRVRSLRALFLEGSNIGDVTLTHLVRLPNLEYLGLGSTEVTDTGLQLLASMPNLRAVDLGQRVTDSGIAALRSRRPDLDARPDEFAFLAPLRPRRVEQAFAAMLNHLLPVGTVTPAAKGLRVYALVFPADTAVQVDEVLERELPARGWEKVPWPGYRRTGVPIALGSRSEDVDQVFLNQNGRDWGFLMPSAGERVIVVSRNVAP